MRKKGSPPGSEKSHGPEVRMIPFSSTNLKKVFKCSKGSEPGKKTERETKPERRRNRIRRGFVDFLKHLKV